MSARPSTSSPDSASGATYCGVPTKKPVRVSRSSGGSSASRAMPKSSSFTRRATGSYMMFSGFRSRWTMPAACAAASASASWRISATASAGARRPSQRAGSAEAAPRPGLASPRLFDASAVYRSMGELVGGGALPFIASVRYLAGPTPDSTLALFSVSLTNQTLTFQRRGSEFVAEYHVEASFRTDSTSLSAVRQIGSDEQVRVRTFQETLRTDESVIYQH